jgi:hypothetical protein
MFFNFKGEGSTHQPCGSRLHFLIALKISDFNFRIISTLAMPMRIGLRGSGYVSVFEGTMLH